MSKIDIEKLKAENCLRDMVLDSANLTREDIDEDARTVRLAFSSEEPVERWWGREILDHSPESVDLTRLKDGGAVLVDHDRADHVGVVEAVSVDSDRRGRATVRFGRSNRATEVFNDVIDGIRRNISVGYRVRDAEVESVSDEGDTWRINRWEPLEISFVSIPADASVGVGRSDADDPKPDQINAKSQEGIQMPDAKEKTTPAKTTPEVDQEKIRVEIREKEVSRIKDLEALGRKFDKGDLSMKFIQEGKSVEDFRAALLDSFDKAPAAQPVTTLDLSTGERQRYSLIRAINAAVTGNWKGAEFEMECSRQIADRLGREPKGFFVPYDVQRDMTKGGTNVGGEFVGTDHLADSWIDALRASSVTGRLGATMLPGLVGDVDIPKVTGSATFYWVDEDADVTSSDVGTGTVVLSPKTVGGAVPMSRRLLKQTSPAIEAVVENDLVQGAALAIDAAAINGSGASGQPLGIIGQTGVATQTVVDVGGVPTWEELVGFETAVAANNALMGSLGYATTPAVHGGLKTTPKDAGSGIMLAAGGEANGYPIIGSTQVPTSRTVFGNWSDVLIGMWGVLDIEPDKATKAASGGLVLRVFQDVDIAVRHGQSFCIDA